ncbi:MAG: S8 family peptidase [Rhodospirillaceae bacterium]|nr:S8 family peptidase [Rhodospirillaceae bacterium]
MAEVRLAGLVESATQLSPTIQRRWVKEAQERVVPAPEQAPTVCLLDTGIYQHSLFGGSLNKRDIYYVVGPDGHDRDGHGTEMAGLALFGHVTDLLTSPMDVQLVHRLESVKVLPDPGASPNPPETYGAVTAAGVSMPEVSTPRRRRAFCMPNSDHGSRSDGRPTLWSATVDALSFGTDVVATESGLELLTRPDPESSRLLIVSGGNVRDDHRIDFLAVCDTSVVEDPGQSWNALTVGAFTDLVATPSHPDFDGYTPLAPQGELSPFSRTSAGFSPIWPLKPDIVMEGGNLLASPDATYFDPHEVVSIATTSHLEPLGRPLTTANATSAAAAQAARLAAQVAANYPDLWPETVRGLLVHAAEWTPPMKDAIGGARNLTVRRQLLRRYGFGVPTEERVLRSASNAVTLIAQSYIQPFERVNSSRTRLREMHLHDLPWPREQLLELGEAPVRLRVTLSYFIEPNASSRGWRGRYVYPSHGMRFDIRRSGETTGEFERRLNKLAEAEEGGTRRSSAPEPQWLVGPEGRQVGSLHADLWEGTAAELADCGVLGVFPVGGWWKNNNRADRTSLSVRYALLVSLFTPEVEIDLYTPIAAEIGISVPIET